MCLFACNSSSSGDQGFNARRRVGDDYMAAKLHSYGYEKVLQIFSEEMVTL